MIGCTIIVSVSISCSRCYSLVSFSCFMTHLHCVQQTVTLCWTYIYSVEVYLYLYTLLIAHFSFLTLKPELQAKVITTILLSFIVMSIIFSLSCFFFYLLSNSLFMPNLWHLYIKKPLFSYFIVEQTSFWSYNQLFLLLNITK